MAARVSLKSSIRSLRIGSRCPQCLFYTILSTSNPAHASVAADPTDLDRSDAPRKTSRKAPRKASRKELGIESKFARIVPTSPSYFSCRPKSTDGYLKLQSLLRRYQALPTVGPGQAPRVAWRNVTQFRLLVGESVGAAKYHQVRVILQRLNRIHPTLMPAEVKDAMDFYKRDNNPFGQARRPAIIDEDGKVAEVGRRKSSSAKVYLIPGNGEVRVNGRSLNIAFGRIHDRESALWALKATERMDKYNVFALVKGGGTTGQAEAVTLGVAKALLAFEPALKPALRRAGCVTRDPRRVERKKPGRVKARKMPTWVKR